MGRVRPNDRPRGNEPNRRPRIKLPTKPAADRASRTVRPIFVAFAIMLAALAFLPQCDVTGLRSAVEKKVMPPAMQGAITLIHSLLEIAPGETAFDFGSYVQNQESSNEETFIIQNSGSSNLVLSDATKVQLGGPDASHFVLSTALTETTIQPGHTTRFTILFRPSDIGKKTVGVTIPYNGPGSPFQFQLVGTGTTNPVAQINVKYLSTSLVSGGDLT